MELTDVPAASIPSDIITFISSKKNCILIHTQVKALISTHMPHSGTLNQNS